MHYGNKTAETDKSVCNIFADYFHTVYSNFTANVGVDETYAFLNIISFVDTNTNEVLKILKSLDMNKGAGSDDVPPSFIILQRIWLCPYLYYLKVLSCYPLPQKKKQK